MAESAPLLELHGVAKSYSSVRVLQDVDFEVRAGEVHGLVGENGAGKSTLMNIVSGVAAPDSGEILWRGAPARLRGPREAQRLGIAFVHQELALVPQLSAAENIFLGRHPARRGWVRWGGIAERAGRLLAELGCAIDPRRAVSGLSLAERQMVEIGRALAFESRLLILDEPTAPLGEREAEGLFRTMRVLAARDVGVVFISHRLKEVLRACDRVSVMRDGRRVLTKAVADTGHDELVRAMVGAELSAAPAVETFGGTEEALRVSGSISLSVRRGEVVGLAGLAGAGRTELLEWLFGAGEPRVGRVFVDGREVRVRSPRDAIRHGMALVPDDRKAKGLVPGASLGMNMALAGGRSRLFIRAAVERRDAERLRGELRIRAAGLDEPVAHLSGGNQQKAVLAKWLLAGAKVFLLDEPTRGIDVRSKAEIYELIRALARSGAAVLVASSELEELLRLADRIVVIERGRVAGELARHEADEERIMRLATGGAA